MTRVLTEDELQVRLEEQFPVERGNRLGSVRLWNPELHLEAARPGRVGLEVALQASVLGMPLLRGRGHFDGELDFRPDSGEVFVRNVEVRDLQVVGLPPEREESLRGLVELIGEATLARTPIYRVDLNGRGIRVESTEVRDGRLVVRLTRERIRTSTR